VFQAIAGNFGNAQHVAGVRQGDNKVSEKKAILDNPWPPSVDQPHQKNNHDDDNQNT